MKTSTMAQDGRPQREAACPSTSTLRSLYGQPDADATLYCVAPGTWASIDNRLVATQGPRIPMWSSTFNGRDFVRSLHRVSEWQLGFDFVGADGVERFWSTSARSLREARFVAGNWSRVAAAVHGAKDSKAPHLNPSKDSKAPQGAGQETN